MVYGNNKRIQIHTMLGRVKVYSATSYTIDNGFLEIIGINEASKIEGEFVYPLHNLEHFNIIKDEVIEGEA